MPVPDVKYYYVSWPDFSELIPHDTKIIRLADLIAERESKSQPKQGE